MSRAPSAGPRHRESRHGYWDSRCRGCPEAFTDGRRSICHWTYVCKEKVCIFLYCFTSFKYVLFFLLLFVFVWHFDVGAAQKRQEGKHMFSVLFFTSLLFLVWFFLNLPTHPRGLFCGFFHHLCFQVGPQSVWAPIYIYIYSKERAPSTSLVVRVQRESKQMQCSSI